MISLALALALFAQDAPAAEPPANEAPVEAPAETQAAAEPTPEEDRLPAGAPKEDYPFVAWCYGALRGYLDMHDEMMPEVTRIESQFRRPGSSLKDDLKVYADMQKDGETKLKQFQSALTAAEKASLRPINTVGAEAVRQGRLIWDAGPRMTKARKAQAWMSWVLPVRCERVADDLEARSKLMGATLRANEAHDETEAAPEDAVAEAPSTQVETVEDAPAKTAPVEDTPAPETPSTEAPPTDDAPGLDAPAIEVPAAEPPPSA